MDLLERMQKLKEQQEIKSQEEIPPEEVKKIPKKFEIKKNSPEKIDSLIESHDISNVHISQDDLWLLYRLKFGKGTRNKRSVLLPQFTEAFKKNLAKLKK